jgi:hypothetical protein
MGAFEEVHARRVTGSLAMYDRLIFKGHLSSLYKQDGARCYLSTQGVAMVDFTAYAKATTARIADHCRGLAIEAGRPVISFDHVKTTTGRRSTRTTWPRPSPPGTRSAKASCV